MVLAWISAAIRNGTPMVSLTLWLAGSLAPSTNVPFELPTSSTSTSTDTTRFAWWRDTEPESITTSHLLARPIVSVPLAGSGITWSADYIAVANAAEESLHLDGFVRIHNGSGEEYENAQVRLVVGTINLVEKIARLAVFGPDLSPQTVRFDPPQPRRIPQQAPSAGGDDGQ